MTDNQFAHRMLMGPGPSGISARVLSAAARPPVGYLDPSLFRLLDHMRLGLRHAFGTDHHTTIPLTGTGMAGMECCFANLVEPGDNVIIGVNGFFGGRMVEICNRLGANVTRVDCEWGGIVYPDHLRQAVAKLGSVKLIACVHAETSTGVQQPLEPLAEIARECGAVFVVDAVTSLGGIPVEVTSVGIDACYSATQKCLGAPPGLSPITVSERALAMAAKRKTPVATWYFDWQLLSGYYDEPHVYHHTVPVNLLFALDEALAEAEEETYEMRFARHASVSAHLAAGLAELGIELFADETHRLPMLTSVKVPDRVSDEAAVRARLLNEYGIEIGGGLGALKGKIWRIGTMGASASHRNVLMLLGALKTVLPR